MRKCGFQEGDVSTVCGILKWLRGEVWLHMVLCKGQLVWGAWRKSGPQHAGRWDCRLLSEPSFLGIRVLDEHSSAECCASLRAHGPTCLYGQRIRVWRLMALHRCLLKLWFWISSYSYPLTFLFFFKNILVIFSAFIPVFSLGVFISKTYHILCTCTVADTSWWVLDVRF